MKSQEEDYTYLAEQLDDMWQYVRLLQNQQDVLNRRINLLEKEIEFTAPSRFSYNNEADSSLQDRSSASSGKPYTPESQKSVGY